MSSPPPSTTGTAGAWLSPSLRMAVQAIRQISAACRRTRSLDSLDAAFEALHAQLGGADHHAITMTGELCDAFPSRREGVAGLREGQSAPNL